MNFKQFEKYTIIRLTEIYRSKSIHLRKLMVCEWNLRKYFLPSASKVHHNMYIKMPTSCMTSFKNFNLLFKCDDTTMPRSVARSTKLPQEKNFMVETI